MYKKNTGPTKFISLVKRVPEYFLITLGGIVGLSMSLYIIIHLFSTAVNL